jgi:glycosyltransferase involved in cell wall biosynthesis
MIAAALSAEGAKIYQRLGIQTINGFACAYEHLPLNVARALNVLALLATVALADLRSHTPVFLCFGTHASLVGYPLSRLLRRRFVVRCMGGDLISLGRKACSLNERIEKAVYRLAFSYTKRAGAIVVMSEWMREFLLTLGVARSNIVKIPNAVDWQLNLINEEHSRSNRQLKLVYVGRFVKAWDAEKGLDLLLNAFALFKKRRPEATLVLVGRGPRLQEIMDLAASLGIQASLHVKEAPGPDHVREILCQSDVFVFPSFFEGMSNALLEAVLCGLPVVATDIPSNREFLSRVQGSILVSLSPQAFCQGLVTIVDDLQRRAELAKKSAAQLAPFYSIESIAYRYEEVLFAEKPSMRT